MYGNSNRKTIYLLWRDGEEGPSGITRGYENTEQGLKSYIEFPAETYTAKVGTRDKVYERTYKVYGSTGSAVTAKECISKDGKIRLYLNNPDNGLQEVINWKGSEADTTSISVPQFKDFSGARESASSPAFNKDQHSCGFRPKNVDISFPRPSAGNLPTPLAFSVVPPWGLSVVPPEGMSVIPTGGVSVYPQGGCRYYPLGVCRYYPLGVWG